jgi:hypothetical protein
VYWRISENVIVIRVKNEDQKREIMKYKNKLKGGMIFTENDLSWEERKM